MLNYDFFKMLFAWLRFKGVPEPIRILKQNIPLKLCIENIGGFITGSPFAAESNLFQTSIAYSMRRWILFVLKTILNHAGQPVVWDCQANWIKVSAWLLNGLNPPDNWLLALRAESLISSQNSTLSNTYVSGSPWTHLCFHLNTVHVPNQDTQQ